MTRSTSYREQGRAMFLAAIMVLSMVAASAAFAGSAAAQTASGGVSVTSGDGSTVAPGGSFDITVEVTNTGSSSGTVTGVQASSLPSGVSVSWAGGGLSTSGLSPGDSATFDGTVSVGSGVSTGSYSLTAEGQVTSSFTGSTPVDFTVAQNQPDDTDYTERANNLGRAPHVDEGSYDDLTGGVYWQGQEISVDLGVGNSDVQIRERTATDSSRLVGVQTAESGTVTFDTGEYSSGDYFLTDDTGSIVDFQNADGLPVLNETFEVAVQSLSVSDFDEDTVTTEGVNSQTDFEFSSNRAGYPINVTTASEDLSAEQLANLFEPVGDSGNSPTLDVVGTNEPSDDDAITLTSDDSTPITDADDYVIDFATADIDAGEYEFVFSAADATAENTDTITVSESNVDADFNPDSTIVSSAGDIAEFNISLTDTDEAYVQIGGSDVNFVDVLYVKADDRTEPVSFDLNTRALGSDTAQEVVYNPGDNVDDFISATQDGHEALRQTTIDDGAEHIFVDGDGANYSGGSYNAFAGYLNELGTIDDTVSGDGVGRYQLDRPPQSAEYDIVVAADDDSNDGIFEAEAGTSTASNALTTGLMRLQQPEITGVETYVAPEEDADETQELAEINNVTTQRTDIALDDRLFVEVQATGIFGSLAAKEALDGDSADGWGMFDADAGTPISTLGAVTNDEANTGIEFTFEAQSAVGNQNPVTLNLSNTDTGEAFVVPSDTESKFWLVVDTSADDAFDNGDPVAGANYDVSLGFDADDHGDSDFEYSRAGPDNTGQVDGGPFDAFIGGFPYLGEGETREGDLSFSFQERNIQFDNLNNNLVLEVPNSANATVSGTTNVAPGSDAEIRLSSTNANNSFRKGSPVTIASDGSVSATYDLSSSVDGDEFDGSLLVGGTVVDSQEGEIVQSVGDDEGDQTDEGTDEGDQTDEGTDEGDQTDEGTDEGDQTDEGTDEGDQTDEGDDEQTDDGTPGFGAVVALVALVGAALLAVRRQD